MIANKDFEIVNVSGDYMAVPVGKQAFSFHGVVTLSEPAAFLLKHMDEPRTMEELVELLLSEYDVDRPSIEKDIATIIKTFIEYNLVLND